MMRPRKRDVHGTWSLRRPRADGHVRVGRRMEVRRWLGLTLSRVKVRSTFARPAKKVRGSADRMNEMEE